MEDDKKFPLLARLCGNNAMEATIHAEIYQLGDHNPGYCMKLISHAGGHNSTAQVILLPMGAVEKLLSVLAQGGLVFPRSLTLELESLRRYKKNAEQLVQATKGLE